MLKIKNLSLTLNKNIILKDINLDIESNKITAIIGKNASGKTSLIKCINGIYKYNGDILYDDCNLLNMDSKYRAQKISILPQLLKYPHIIVYDILLMGLNPYLKLHCKIDDLKKAKVDNILQTLKIEQLKDKYLDELSGGQRQIVYLALQLVQDAEIMIFDEPSSFMDMNYESDLLNNILKLKENKTIVIVMHNINKVIKYADNIIILDNGIIIYSGSTEECLKNEMIEKNFNLKKYQIGDTIIFDT